MMKTKNLASSSRRETTPKLHPPSIEEPSHTKTLTRSQTNQTHLTQTPKTNFNILVLAAPKTSKTTLHTKNFDFRPSKQNPTQTPSTKQSQPQRPIPLLPIDPPLGQSHFFIQKLTKIKMDVRRSKTKSSSKAYSVISNVPEACGQ